MTYKGLMLTIISLTLCSACALSNSLAPTTALPPLPSPTFQPPTNTVVPPSPVPSLTATPIPTATQVIVDSIEAEVIVNSLFLRSGPGTIFPVVSKYTTGSMVNLVAREPGDQWVKVETPDNRVGWMLSQMLEPQGSLQELRIADLKNFMIIDGKITDTAGLPVDKIIIAVYQKTAQGELRTDAESTSEGFFYTYLPPDSSGIWFAGVVGVNCTSLIMDSACEYHGSFDPLSQQLPGLPPADPVTFTYRP